MSKRIIRVNELLAQEIAKYILSEFGSSLGIITVTDVETSPDLQNAKVFISVLEPRIVSDTILIKSLTVKSFELQKNLGKKFRMKYTPKLTFCLDRSQEEIVRVQELLDKINRD